MFILLQVRYIDSDFIWTEPHSKRIKVKVVFQEEVSIQISMLGCFTRILFLPIMNIVCLGFAPVNGSLQTLLAVRNVILQWQTSAWKRHHHHMQVIVWCWVAVLQAVSFVLFESLHGPYNSRHIVYFILGARWLSGRFGAWCPQGHRFKPHSSHHVGTLVKSFNRSFLCKMMWRLHGRQPCGLIWLLLSSVHTLLVNILRYGRMYIKI